MSSRMASQRKKSVTVFFITVIVLSAVAGTMICTGGTDWWYLILMWMPAVAATIANCISFREEQTRFSLKGLFSKAGFHKCRLRYIFAGLLLPVIYLLIPYMVYWKLYPQNFAYHDVSIWIILKDCLPLAIIGTIVSLLSALGEEIGWRGFMVPALYQRLGLNKMLVISSLFWCCWHFPLLVAGGYMSGTPLWYQIPAFTLCIFPVGVMVGILTIQSGSVWPAALLHAAHNNYDQAILGVITAGTNKMYYVSETGILTILCAWGLAITMYLIAKKNERNEKNEAKIVP